MATPDFDVIFAARAAILADMTVAGFIGDRFYDPPPQDGALPYPYVAVGPTDYRRDDADCIDATELTFQLDVWDKGSTVRCRQVCDAIVDVLHDAQLDLANSALAEINLTLARVFRDPDNIHAHGVLQFTAVVETAD